MNIATWIDRWAGFSPDKTAIGFAGGSLTCAAMASEVGALASALQHRLGVKRGDRVACLDLNSPRLLVTLFACARIGAIFLPLNWRLAAAEHHFIFEDCTPSALFVGEAFIDQVAAEKDRIPGKAHVVAMGPARAGFLSFDGLLADGARSGPANAEGTLGDAALICYTSGTTGRPKGAVLSQNALTYAAINGTHMHDMTSGDLILTTLPLFHVGGLNIQTLPALHAGASVLLHAKFDPAAALADIREARPDLTVLVPAQLQAMMALPAWEETDLTCLRAISTGSTFVPVPLIEQIEARGVPMIQVYGSTETAPAAVFQRAADRQRKPGSCGKVAVHCAMRIVDDAGRDVAPGASGEIWIRGANVMDGYWNLPDESAEALAGGWFHTGDIGHVDEDGFLFVDDRKKDMIISGGENIYPAELENVLAGCAAIREAAVVGRKDAKWGEVPVAVVVAAENGKLGAGDVLALFEARLARFKHPRDVVFVAELPRNAMGKIQKHEISRMLETK